jgi:hypothetical protein
MDWLLVKAKNISTSTSGVMGRLLSYGRVSGGSWLTLPFASRIIDDLFVKAKVLHPACREFFFYISNVCLPKLKWSVCIYPNGKGCIRHAAHL